MAVATTIRMKSPVASAPDTRNRLAPLVDDVHGKAAGFRVQWSSFDVFMKRFEELLRERKQPRSVHIMDQNWESPAVIKKGLKMNYADPGWAKEWDEFAKNADWAVVGLAA
ncbi:MAG: hypothetical protein AAB502_00800 [Chloroflexota bacterium]